MVMFSPPYDMPPWRPPSEAKSILIRVTRGCPWNRCAFCIMYKNIKFETKSFDDIKKDIDTASRIYKRKDSVFIGDSDSLTLKTEKLVPVLDYIKESFPNITRITSYTRGRTLYKKTLKELETLREHGLTRLHVGLESGSEKILRLINKGLTKKEIIEASQKVKAAGFELSLYVILGLGGKDLSQEHIEETADVINRCKPDFVRIRTLIPVEGTEIATWMEKGTFKPITQLESVIELKNLIELIECETNIVTDHVSNAVFIDEKLPYRKETIVSTLDNLIEKGYFSNEPLCRIASL